jgi:hypothetical protein
MAIEWLPSSFICDREYEAHFCENTIKEMKRMSLKKKVGISEDRHAIIFYKGKAIEMTCPKMGTCRFTKQRW